MHILKRGSFKNCSLIFLLIVFLVCLCIYSLSPKYSFYRIREKLLSLSDANLPVCTLRHENDTRFLLEQIKNATKCNDNVAYTKFERKGEYWILYNYVVSDRRFKCEESVTYATHADYTFLNNLPPVLEKWQGPLSVALHAPGTDFQITLDSIAYLRSCTPFVKEFVNFHIYFGEAHVPEKIPPHVDDSLLDYNCSLPPPYENVDRKEMYATRNQLLYPINVGRNVARTISETHYVFSSDIELYPSPNFIPQFQQVIVSCWEVYVATKPSVFAFNVFEVQSNQSVPNTKTEVLELLSKGLAVPFHNNICPECHTVPGFQQWKTFPDGNLSILKVARRIGKFYHWEPFYIGTNEEPLFDERLSWEGESDKIVQAYTMCLMKYSFLIMDGAFLVHSPGIKFINNEKRQWREKYVNATNHLVNQVILPELTNKFDGTSSNCEL